MDDPDVIVGVDPDADGRAEDPVVRQRLWPRVDRPLKRGAWTAPLVCDCRGGFLENRLGNAERDQESRRLAPTMTMRGSRQLPHLSTLAFRSLPRQLERRREGGRLAREAPGRKRFSRPGAGGLVAGFCDAFERRALHFAVVEHAGDADLLAHVARQVQPVPLRRGRRSSSCSSSGTPISSCATSAHPRRPCSSAGTSRGPARDIRRSWPARRPARGPSRWLGQPPALPRLSRTTFASWRQPVPASPLKTAPPSAAVPPSRRSWAPSLEP